MHLVRRFGNMPQHKRVNLITVLSQVVNTTTFFDFFSVFKHIVFKLDVPDQESSQLAQSDQFRFLILICKVLCACNAFMRLHEQRRNRVRRKKVDIHFLFRKLFLKKCNQSEFQMSGTNQKSSMQSREREIWSVEAYGPRQVEMDFSGYGSSHSAKLGLPPWKVIGCFDNRDTALKAKQNFKNDHPEWDVGMRLIKNDAIILK